MTNFTPSPILRFPDSPIQPLAPYPIKPSTQPSDLFTWAVQMSVPYRYEGLYYGQALKALGWERKDGVYVYRTGNEVLFTAHLDTVTREPVDLTGKVHRAGNLITCWDEILGADDRAGVALVLYLAHVAQVPATYILCMGEEAGCQGIQDFLDWQGATSYLDAPICLSLDRKGYTDIITHQMGEQGASADFSEVLAAALFKQGLMYMPCDKGLYTDSYHLIDLVPEVVNLSVGYFGSHANGEIQDVGFLDRLGVALAGIQWAEMAEFVDYDIKNARIQKTVSQNTDADLFDYVGSGWDRFEPEERSRTYELTDSEWWAEHTKADGRLR